jgi:hypothetical protein
VQCPFCQTEITAAARYCPHCGKKLDLSFEEVKQEFAQQYDTAKEDESARESRRVLAIAVFFFAVVLTVFIAIPSPRKPDVMPVYRADCPGEIDEVYMEIMKLPQFEIPE